MKMSGIDDDEEIFEQSLNSTESLEGNEPKVDAAKGTFDDDFIADQIPNRFNPSMTIQEKANLLFQDTEILAPMVRASTIPLRTLALSYGADLVFTEEMIDRSITNCHRILNPHLQTIDYVRCTDGLSPKVLKRLQQKDEVPVILRISPTLERGRLIYQMGTGEAALALPAAQKVEADVDGIDINMGCPKKFSVSGGMGSALLSDLPRACDIIKTLRRNISIPVSAKVRMLKDTSSTLDFLRGLVHAGANALTIHAREVGDSSNDPAKWDRLIELVQLLKSTPEGSSVPVIINGDLFTRNDMINMRRKCRADGVMLARPALYNISIFRKPAVSTSDETNSYIKGEEETRYSYDSPLLLSKTQVVKDYLSHALRFPTHPKNIKYVICEFMSNRRLPSSVITSMPQSYPGGQTIGAVCKCHSMEEICRVWDVNTSVYGRNAYINEKQNIIADEHKYDDRYFLDPDIFRQEQEQALEHQVTKRHKV